MSESIAHVAKKPGIVILVAIFQFFSCAFFMMLALLSGLAIAFGAAWGIDDYVSRQMARYSSTPNFSYGLTLIFSFAAGIFLMIAVYFLLLGLGLLKGKKPAWYLQVATSLFGLVGMPLGFMWSLLVLPLGALVNVVILILFFQPKVRNFFGV